MLSHCGAISCSGRSHDQDPALSEKWQGMTAFKFDLQFSDGEVVSRILRPRVNDVYDG
jgi:hypothetical protein